MVLAHDIKTVERTQDIHIGVDVNFESMLIKKKTLKGLEISGFYKPSPVQLHGIPLGKCGFDLFLEAKSGTGKTAVFTVISLEKLDLQKDLQTIILAPTREIAAQICDVIKQIGSMYKGLNVEVVMGGLPIGEDIEKFQKKVHILVGSPGRMRHLIQEKHVNVSAVRLLVLDEADKLMDKSFQSDINYIFSVLPKQKQVIMSSATYPESLKSVMQNYVHKVQHICPESNAVLLGINQLVTTVESHPNIVRQTQIKFKELLKILTQREFKQCLIFCNYQIRVVELCKMLLRAKWPAEQLHAQLDQCDRLDALKTLQDYKCRILVSTDLAARGIDASNVDLVINFEPPYEWQTYLHRMGRAGRFGAYGIVITILSVGKEMVKFKEMMRSYSSSLNLVNMWDNNKFELDTHSIWETGNEPEDFCSSPEVTGMGQKIQKKCALSPKSTSCIKDEYDIETFKMLSDCFEKSKECKIESFSDLIASLNVYETDNQEGNEILNTLPEAVGEQQFQENGVRLETTRRVSDECGIESFTMLSNSFEKYKECKIESFTDLIDSFKGHEAGSSNKEESEIEDIIFKKSHDLTSKLKSKPKTGIPSHSDTDLEVETVNKSNNILAKNIINEPHNPEEFRIPFTKSYFEAQIKENSSKNKIKKQICPDKIIFDISDSHKALIDAGLPTAFGSTKTIFNQFCQNERTSIKQKYIKNRKLNHLNYEGSGTNVSKDNHRKNSILNEGGYNCHLNTFSRSTKYDRYSKNDTFDRLSKIEYDTGKISPKCYEKYLAWYNHLKSHVKHVEMSIYISELSKN